MSGEYQDFYDWSPRAKIFNAEFEVAAEMRLAIWAWLTCEPSKRPSAKALGIRIEMIAEKLDGQH